MEKQTLNEELMKLYEGYEKIDNPQPRIVEGTDDVYLKNGYMTFDEFVNKITKLV